MLGVCLAGSQGEVGDRRGRKKRGVVFLYSRVRNGLQFRLSMILFLTHILCGTNSILARPS
jgi:hypothetical protein